MHSTVYIYSRFSCIDRVKMLSYYFLSDLIVKNMSLFMKFYKKKIVWQFDVRGHVTQDLGGTRLLKISP